MTAHYVGRCLCGAVQYEINGPIDGPIACHCRDCQRHSGGSFWAAVTARLSDVVIRAERLGWVRVTHRAWRGFCRDCGGYLFWQPTGGNTLDIGLGTLELSEPLPLAAHVHVAEALQPPPEDGVPRFDAARPATLKTPSEVQD